MELPAGTENCPHCGDPVDEVVGGEEGGAPEAGGPEAGGGAGALAGPAAAPPVAPKLLDEPPGGGLAEEPLPSAAPSPEASGGAGDPGADAGAAGGEDEERAARRRERAERRAQEPGSGIGEVIPGKRRSEGRAARGEGGEGRPGRPSRAERGAAAPTDPAKLAEKKRKAILVQKRGPVLLAILLWFYFVALLGGEFGVSVYGATPGQKLLLQDVMFGVLGLFAMLFLYAHLKMGRLIAVVTAVFMVALTLMSYFMNKAENAPAIAGTVLWLLVQFVLLTGGTGGFGAFMRSFLGLVLGLAAGILFAIPAAIEALVAHVEKAMESGEEAGKSGRAEETWPLFLEAIDRFDRMEKWLLEVPKEQGVDLKALMIEEHVAKPMRREKLLPGLAQAAYRIVKGSGSERWSIEDVITTQKAALEAARKSETPPEGPTEELKAKWAKEDEENGARWKEWETKYGDRAKHEILRIVARYLRSRPAGLQSVKARSATAELRIGEETHRESLVPESEESPHRFTGVWDWWNDKVQPKPDLKRPDLPVKEKPLKEAWSSQKLNEEGYLKDIAEKLKWQMGEVRNCVMLIRMLVSLDATLTVAPPPEKPPEEAGPPPEEGAAPSGDEKKEGPPPGEEKKEGPPPGEPPPAPPAEEKKEGPPPGEQSPGEEKKPDSPGGGGR
ncbi:MAG: hypothetical protein L0216_21845 [Planctomycetales bacterium]|nr:hypothetical protein [Planctomycetales bacterium]